MNIVVTNFIVGIPIGLTSIGGAALMTPFLIAFGGVPAVLSVGTDLVFGAVTKIVRAAVHYRQGNVDLRIVKLPAIGSIPGSFLGFFFVHRLERMGVDSNARVRHALGVVLLAVAVIILYRNIFINPEARALPSLRIPALTIAVGALVGFAVGLTSCGERQFASALSRASFSEKCDGHSCDRHLSRCDPDLRPFLFVHHCWAGAIGPHPSAACWIYLWRADRLCDGAHSGTRDAVRIERVIICHRLPANVKEVPS
jgi:Sulfite exporter TauE/SafE